MSNFLPYVRVSVYCLGDRADQEWADLLNKLAGGYIILSGVFDGQKINYVLKTPKHLVESEKL